MLKTALSYLKLGWSVIPLRPKEKVPLLSTWREYQDRQPTVAEVTQWFDSTPTANLGLITGRVSGVVVVDLEYDGLKEAERLKLCSSVSSITGKGKHLYFKYPGSQVCNVVALNGIRGLDVRGDGGYVLLPPSIHPSGKRYAWVNAPTVNSRLQEFSLSVGDVEKDSKPSDKNWISDALASLQNGNRNNTFTKIVGRLHRERWDSGAILGLLKPHAESVHFPINELEVIIKSVERYPSKSAEEHPVRQQLTVRTFSNSFGDYQQRKAATGSSIEYPTGFARFDKLTGGLRRQEILTVAARTGTGKTNWLISCAKHLCSQGKSVLLFSTEMAYDTIWDRYIGNGESQEVLQSHDFFVCDDFTPDLTRIENTLKDVQPDVFMFDHINHVGEEHVELAKFMQGLKMLARKFDCPGVVSAQLNRAADWIDNRTGERVVPRLSMLKGSGTIEQVSAQVLLLSETTVQPDQNNIIGSVDKNRYGNRDIIDFVLQKNPLKMVEQV